MPTSPVTIRLPPWRIAPERELALASPCVMGILNITPDSFSDGGLHLELADALDAANRMLNAGATLLDIGGESTRPGSRSVDANEQIRRTIPVIRELAARSDGDDAAHGNVISIDTTSAVVAEAALDAGATIINDTSAGTDDADMLHLAAARQCGIVLMHRLRPPPTDSYSTQYENEPDYGGDVYSAVRDHLARRIEAAINAGIHRNAIVIDPGLGFGKSVSQNYELASRLGELQLELGLPALSAASRKSFLSRPAMNHTDSPANRLGASVAITLSHWQLGVRLFRVHDVAAHAQALETACRIAAEQTRPIAG